MKNILLALFPLLAISSITSAEQDTRGFFLGGAVGTVSTRESSTDDDFEANGNTGGIIMGYHILKNLGVEGRIFSAAYSEFVTHTISFGAKGTLFINDKTSFYGKAGAAGALLMHEDKYREEEGLWDNESGYGLTLAAGMNYAIGESIYLNAAYDFLIINLEDSDNRAKDSDLEMHYFTLGLYYQF